MEYLAGLFLADGYFHKNCSENSNQRCYLETKDKKFAESLNNLYGDRIIYRQRTVRTGTICDMYQVRFTDYCSEFLKSLSRVYKDFRNYYYSLSDYEKHKFILGLFDGDGSICEYSNSKKCRVLLYSADGRVSEIVEDYLKRFQIKYSEGYDRRGHEIKWYNIGSPVSIAKLYLMWYRGATIFLNRKRALFEQSLKEYTWHQYENILTVDRQIICKSLGITSTDMSYIEGGWRKSPHRITKVKLDKIPDSYSI